MWNSYLNSFTSHGAVLGDFERFGGRLGRISRRVIGHGLDSGESPSLAVDVGAGTYRFLPGRSVPAALASTATPWPFSVGPDKSRNSAEL